jgi:hypothetical protein
MSDKNNKMKNTILFLLILVSFQAYAQKINFGVKGGLNHSTFANSKEIYDEVEPRIGFHVGLSLSKELSEKFSLRTEVIYSQKGITAVDTVILTDPSGRRFSAAFLRPNHSKERPLVAGYFGDMMVLRVES